MNKKTKLKHDQEKSKRMIQNLSNHDRVGGGVLGRRARDKNQGVEADRGVETVEAGGKGENKEASRDVETLAAGDEGNDWGSAEQSRRPSGRQIRRSTMERRGPSRNTVEPWRLGVRLGVHGAWESLRD
ncbi:hypothetical protein AMECASPLE_011403 [Ameca splendens]|uniref:Uncharacterized protein n=1 Tax=Ameca splendens TaxID=208324 RepID=A0ABV0ZAI2_9TELE